MPKKYQLRIRKERRDRLFSIEAVARRLQMSEAKLQALETGKRAPQLPDAQKIAKFYGLGTDEAFARVEVP